MLTSGRYKGDPVRRHVEHAERIDHAMFARWLALWEASTNELLSDTAARAMQAKAKRMAGRLIHGIGLEGG